MDVFVQSLLLPLLCAALASAAPFGLTMPLYYGKIGNFSKDFADVFVVPVTVGNPAATFNLTLALNYYETAVIGTGSLSSDCGDTNRRAFDSRRSTTFHSFTEIDVFIDGYMIGHGPCRYAFDAQAIYGQDDFLGLRNVGFSVISSYKGTWNPNWPSDGYLGLAGPNDDTQLAHSTAKQLAQKAGGDNAVVSFFLKRNRVPGQKVGQIAFGGVPGECGSVSYPEPYFADRDGWNFRVNSASLGSISKNGLGGKGFLSSVQAILLEMPNSTFVEFMAEIGAKLDRSKGTYFVDCEHATTLPALNIRAGTQQFTFQFHDYVDMKTDAAKCEVLLRGGGELFWTFGNKLWESYCVVLDYGKRRVGFASL